MSNPKPKSRSARWQDACSRAHNALEELREIQEEYQEWKDNLPENLESSPLGEKLETVCDIDIEEAQTIVAECEDAELPLGFGRD